MKNQWSLAGGLAAAFLMAACSGGSAPIPTADAGDGGQPAPPPLGPGGPIPSSPDKTMGTREPLGGPIDGLTPDELAAFERGRVIFEKRFKPSEGLGPLYNAVSCQSCHSTPQTGGSSELYRNFYVAHYGLGTGQLPLPGLPSLVVPAYGSGTDFYTQGIRTHIPPIVDFSPVFTAQRNAPQAFGSGLFEFVSNTTIILLTDANDIDGDGISGRFNTDGAIGLGRFGWKAQVNNLESFTRAPLNNQMGITTDPFLGSDAVVTLSFCAAVQGGTGMDDPIEDSDDVPDPELSSDDLGDLIAFSRFLAPPSKVLPFTAAAKRGELLFDSVGCTDCHLPVLNSSRGPIEPYTDLLLHDMGPDLADGINIGSPQASVISPGVTGAEWRTAPLWGVSLHAPFLHDGRAETLFDAIDLHAGEGQQSRDNFMALTAGQRADLIEFLEHL